MSLNFELGDVKDYRAIWPDTSTPEGMITHNIIFSALVVALSELTEKTIDEWEFRIRLLVRVGILSPESWPMDKLRGDLERRVGLRLNVSRKARRPFFTHVIAILSTQMEHEMRAAKQRAASVPNV